MLRCNAICGKTYAMAEVTMRMFAHLVQESPWDRHASDLFCCQCLGHSQGFAVNMIGPVGSSHPCNTSLRAIDTQHNIYQTGVVSYNNEYVLTGTSNNMISIVDVYTLASTTFQLSANAPDGIIVR